MKVGSRILLAHLTEAVVLWKFLREGLEMARVLMTSCWERRVPCGAQRKCLSGGFTWRECEGDVGNTSLFNLKVNFNFFLIEFLILASLENYISWYDSFLKSLCF